MSLAQLKSDAGLASSAHAAEKQPRSPKGAISAINIKSPRIMDFRPSQSLTSGLKRIGGRKSSVSRLGNFARRGRPVVEHKF
jgi:hypothetical protein